MKPVTDLTKHHAPLFQPLTRLMDMKVQVTNALCSKIRLFKAISVHEMFELPLTIFDEVYVC